MSSINMALNKVRAFGVRYAPQLFTAGTIVSLGATAVTSCQAQHKSDIEIWNEEAALGRKLTPKEKVRLTWTNYIPPAFCVVGGSVAAINSTRLALAREEEALALLSESQGRFKSLETAMVSSLGTEVVEQIREEASTAHAEKTGNEEWKKAPVIYTTGEGEVLCLEKLSKRYFKTTWQDLKEAEIQFAEALMDGLGSFVPANEYFDLLGLEPTDIGWDIGWDYSVDGRVKFKIYSLIDSETHLPMYVVEPDEMPKPKRRYY